MDDNARLDFDIHTDEVLREADRDVAHAERFLHDAYALMDLMDQTAGQPKPPHVKLEIERRLAALKALNDES